MSLRILLAISDRACARVALETLQQLCEYPALARGEVILLGLVQSFQTIYAHRHPAIGRRIRNLIWQVNRFQVEEAERLVDDAATRFELLGWNVRREFREGDGATAILRCCRAMSPQLVVVGSCLKSALPLGSWRNIWQRVVREAGRPVLVIQHQPDVSPPDPNETHVSERQPDGERAVTARSQVVVNHMTESTGGNSC